MLTAKLISKMKDTFIHSPKNIITIYVVFLLTNSCIASGLIIKVKFLTWRFSSCNIYFYVLGRFPNFEETLQY